MLPYHCQHRSYPRPKETCSDCQGVIILCWGEIIKKPYWRHKSASGTGHTPSNGESLTHKMAKQYIKNHLERGGTITLHCKGHIPGEMTVISNNNRSDMGIRDHTSTSISLLNHKKIFNLPRCHTVSEEVRYRSPSGAISIFDVAVVPPTSDLSTAYGIEIYNTHRVTNIEGREAIVWFEVSAESVLDQLDTTQTPHNITLDNISECRCNMQRYKVISPSFILTDEYDETYGTFILERSQSKNTPVTVTRKKQSTSLFDYSSLSNHDLARHLGYMWTNDLPGTDIYSILDVVKTSTRISKQNNWFYKPKNERQCPYPPQQWMKNHKKPTKEEKTKLGGMDDMIYAEVRSRSKCLRCDVNVVQSPKYPKVYCSKCYYSIKGANPSISDYVREWESPQRTTYVKEKLSFLSNIPSTSRECKSCAFGTKSYPCNDCLLQVSSLPCVFCRVNGPNIIPYIWWNGERRQCCSSCVENICK